MDKVIIWLIAIPLIILEIVMIIKFFQIANDIRALKQYLVDNYKMIKGKNKDGDTIEMAYYGKNLLEKTTEDEWEKERDEILQAYEETPSYKKWQSKQSITNVIIQESENCQDKHANDNIGDVAQ